MSAGGGKTLVTYTTWTGATREVAAAIADVLREDGQTVDVTRVRDVGDIDAYSSVVVGTSVHIGRLPRDVRKFVKRNREALAGIQVAYFLVCGAMAEDTEENRVTATGYLDPFAKAAPDVDPVDVGLFGGAVLTNTPEYETLSPLLKIPMKAMAADPEASEDSRDWDAIRAWAEGLRRKLES